MAQTDDQSLHLSSADSAPDGESRSPGSAHELLLENLRLKHLMRQAQAISDMQRTMTELLLGEAPEKGKNGNEPTGAPCAS